MHKEDVDLLAKLLAADIRHVIIPTRSNRYIELGLPLEDLIHGVLASSGPRAAPSVSASARYYVFSGAQQAPACRHYLLRRS